MSELSDWKKHVHEPMVASMERQLKVMTETAAAYVNELKAERDAIEVATIERCAKVADAAEVQQENDNGLANTGGAAQAAELIRALLHKSMLPALPVGECDCGAERKEGEA